MAEYTVREEASAAVRSLSEHTTDESDGNVGKQARERESSHELDESGEGIGEYDILEEMLDIGPNVQKHKKPRMGVKGARCEGDFCRTSIFANVAQYLRYESNIYLCDECVPSDVTDGLDLVDVESKQSERVRMAEMLVGRMRNEGMSESEFYIEDFHFYGHVNVRHGLDDDKQCEITGLCGLDDKKFAVIDHGNSCMKIYSSVTTKILKYIRFGTSPYDATEVKVPHSFTQTQHEFIKTANITESNVQGYENGSGHKNDISEASKAKPGTKTLIAVTIPTLNEIWFVNIDKEPASIAMKLELDLACESIDFCEGQIFVLLRQDISSKKSLYSVLVLSSACQIIEVIHNDGVFTDIHDMAVNNGVIYLTDFRRSLIHNVNIKRNHIDSQIFVHDECSPRGICVDAKSNNLFVCDYNDSTVYMSSEGHEFGPLPLDRLTPNPWSVCFSNGKLFIGYYWNDARPNYVAIFQLT